MAGMRYRKLRIAWSVAWGVACLLLIVLWVRSYSTYDDLMVHLLGLSGFGVGSLRGQVQLGAFGHRDFSGTWLIQHVPIRYKNEWLQELSLHRAFVGVRLLHPQNSDWIIVIPHWFLTILCTVSGASPWFRWRFSLRTLLIAMTLIAVGLGAIVYAMR